MDTELKTAWVEALRSGKYIQGEAYLRKQREGVMTHCCLGVLCDLVGAEFTPYTVLLDGGELVQENSEKFNEAVASFFELDEEFASELADRNDGISSFGYHSFEDIAKIIEERA